MDDLETTYPIARKFGGKLYVNLVVWRPVFLTAKLDSTNLYIYYYIYDDPLLNRQIKIRQYFSMANRGLTAKFNSCPYMVYPQLSQ